MRAGVLCVFFLLLSHLYKCHSYGRKYVWPLQVLFKEIQYVQSPFFQHEKTEFPVTKTLQQQQELLVKDSLLFSLLRHDPCLKDLHGVF